MSILNTCFNIRYITDKEMDLIMSSVRISIYLKFNLLGEIPFKNNDLLNAPDTRCAPTACQTT